MLLEHQEHASHYDISTPKCCWYKSEHYPPKVLHHQPNEESHKYIVTLLQKQEINNMYIYILYDINFAFIIY